MDTDLIAIKVKHGGERHELVFNFAGNSPTGCGEYPDNHRNYPPKVVQRAHRHARYRRIVLMHQCGMLTKADYKALHTC